MLELSSKIKQYFNVDISVKELYDNSTIRALEQWLIEHNADIPFANKQDCYCIPKMDPGAIYPLSMSQLEILNACNLTQNKTLYNIVACYKVYSNCTIVQLRNYLEAIQTKHSALRSRIQNIENDVYQVVCKNFASIASMQVKNDMEFNHVVQKEFFYEFNLYKESLSRFSIIEQNEKLYLLINVHHIMFDGYSLQILLQDLEALIKEKNGTRIDSLMGTVFYGKITCLNKKKYFIEIFGRKSLIKRY